MLIAAAIVVLLIGGVMLVSTLYGPDEEPFSIGFVAGLSGFNSDLGVSGRNGALLAVRDINRKGGVLGRKLSLSIKDDLGDAEVALMVDKEFKTSGIDFVVGHMTSQAAEKTISYANANNMLFVSPTVAAESLTRKDDSFIRTIPSNRMQASVISRQLISDNVLSAIVVIDKSNLSFAQSLCDMFRDYYESGGGEVVFIDYYEPFGDISDQLVNSLNNEPGHGLFVIGGADTAANVSQQLFQKNLRNRLYFPTWAMTPDVITHGGRAVEGAGIVNFFDTSSRKPQYSQFTRDYQKSYGTTPSFSAVFSYEAVTVLANAINNARSTNPQLVKKAITGQQFKGLQGTLRFDAFGDVYRGSSFYHINDGHFVPSAQR